MKTIPKILPVSFLLLIFIATEAIEDQKPQWKGKIEHEDGVKVIKNPKEPLYGEITLELEEDLTIGNEEDENYLFYKSIYIDVDNEGNIFVLDIQILWFYFYCRTINTCLLNIIKITTNY